MINKKRLDLLLFDRGYAGSREKARALIMSGNVYVENQKSDKPGTMYREDIEIEVRKPKVLYVSRGGLKLEKAIKSFSINLKDKVAMDIGASTGGFTDCMLKNGAKKVYAIDVGYGQLDWRLRSDERVVNLERTNIRYLDKEVVKDEIDFFSVDVSFISLKLVLPVVRNFIKNTAQAVCLIKPQFEAGKENVGKNGVVKDALIEDICNFILTSGFDILDLDYSPIKGPKGNIEYLVHIRKSTSGENLCNKEVGDIVNQSHLLLDKV